MCKFDQGFTLCTCNTPKPTVHNKNSRRYKRMREATAPHFTWTLDRYTTVETNWTIEGMCDMPSQDLGGLAAEFVLNQLNQKHCFDFEYQPAEDDLLIIRQEGRRYDFLGFVFHRGQWTVGNHSPFPCTIKEINKGIVEKIQKE